jgi:hypothetical protein
MFINDFSEDVSQTETLKLVLGKYYKDITLEVTDYESSIEIIARNKKRLMVFRMNLSECPGCCTFLIAHDIIYYIHEEATYELVQQIKEKLSEYYEYTAIIQTTIDDQELENTLLAKNNYNQVYDVDSLRTDNHNMLWIKEL